RHDAEEERRRGVAEEEVLLGGTNDDHVADAVDVARRRGERHLPRRAVVAVQDGAPSLAGFALFEELPQRAEGAEQLVAEEVGDRLAGAGERRRTVFDVASRVETEDRPAEGREETAGGFEVGRGTFGDGGHGGQRRKLVTSTP